MRWALLGALVVFTDSGVEDPLYLEAVREVDIGWEIESARLSAAGSMSGIVWLVCQRGCVMADAGA